MSPLPPQRFLNYVAGRERSAAEWLDSVDPATGRPWARIPSGTAADIDDAVRAATAAQPDWGRLAPADRAGPVRAWAAAIAEYGDDLAAIESRDNGRVLRETRGADLPRAVAQVRYHAELADKTLGDTIPATSTALTYTTYEPFGVVGVILPYNAPLSMFFSKVSAALAAGNAVVVKPAEQAACSVLAATRLFEKIDLPPGLVNVVAGPGPVAGEALAGHDGVDLLHFTGSTATGRRITQLSCGNLKKLSLELGGKSPNIVFSDADLDAAAIGVATGIYTGGAGQSCLAGSRILVEAGIFDEFVVRLRDRAAELVVGDPLELATDMGPISFRTQYDKVRSFLNPEVTLFGGRTAEQLFADGSPLRDGYFVEPTLLSAAAGRALTEEIFGPVAVAIPFADEVDAVRIANDTRYGLVAGVWTESLRRAHRMSVALRAGTVWVNTYRRMQWQVPFGGHRESGNGPANGAEALREWQNLKSVWMETGG